MSTHPYPESFIRLPELKALTGFRATSSIYREVAAGRLPAPVKIGERAVAWRASDIAEWQAARPAACSGSAPSDKGTGDAR